MLRAVGMTDVARFCGGCREENQVWLHTGGRAEDGGGVVSGSLQV